MSKVTEKESLETVGQNQPEVIYDSPPTEMNDDVWLAHGAKLLEDSMPGVRSAASELIKALGMLQTLYLGILGFAKFVPESMELHNKALFFMPIIPWVIATYNCLRVLKTGLVEINLRAPGEIREKATKLLEEKQRYLDIAFVLLIAGIVFAFVMVVFRVRM